MGEHHGFKKPQKIFIHLFTNSFKALTHSFKILEDFFSPDIKNVTKAMSLISVTVCILLINIYEYL